MFQENRVKDPFLKSIISPEIFNNLQFGKYTRWFWQDFSVDNMFIFLKALNAFSQHADSVFLERAEKSAFNNCGFNLRGVRALVRMKEILAGNPIDSEPQAGYDKFEQSGPAFHLEFSSSLAAAGEDLSWAAAFNERQFWCLLWYVGEFACRFGADEGYPTLSRDVVANLVVSRALVLTTRIYYGELLDAESAERWMIGDETITDCGMAAVQYRRAVAFDTSEKDSQNRLVVFKQYRQAAELGDCRAYYVLGKMYAAGDGIPQDYASAYDWYSRGSDAESAYQAGELHRLGNGVLQDDVHAFYWFEEAEKRGHALATERMAELDCVHRGGG